MFKSKKEPQFSHLHTRSTGEILTEKHSHLTLIRITRVLEGTDSKGPHRRVEHGGRWGCFDSFLPTVQDTNQKSGEIHVRV